MLIEPSPDIPDGTKIEDIRLPTRLKNALAVAGLKTVGELRGTSDANLFRLRNVGLESFNFLRQTLG
jgi:DNA-directed RNA polymerase alpha subunit